MCRVLECMTAKYVEFLPLTAELRRSRSMSFLLPRSQLALQIETEPEQENGLVPEFSTPRAHSLLAYRFNGSIDLLDNESDSEELVLENDEESFIRDFDECFALAEDDYEDEAIIAHDLEACFADLL